MSELRNLDWGRRKLAKLIRFNVNEADEAFDGVANYSYQTIDDLLNEAQRKIINEVRVYINPDAFVTVQTLTWASGDITRTLPETIHSSNILYIEDITNGNPGTILPIIPLGVANGSGLWFKDRETLQWGAAGPGEDKTLHVRALATPNVLRNEADEPLLIPYDHRDLWIWEAAILARDFADDEAPQAWLARRNDYKDTFHIHIAQGQPWGPGKPAIEVTDGYYVLL
jgi:hypothetical protein